LAPVGAAPKLAAAGTKANIGIQAVLGAPADGHTVLAMSNSFHLAPLLMKNRP
jgi:hypothetical protein